jgi:diguanylate cyclase (GGDEF)-like protein
MGGRPSSLPGVHDPVPHSPRLTAAATAAGPLLLAWAFTRVSAPSGSIWGMFAVLLLAATLSSWESAPWQVRRNERFQGLIIDLSDVFVIAGVVLLPAALAALTSAGSFLLVWRKDRLPFYKIAFNASMYMTCSVAGRVAFDALGHHGHARWLLAASAAGAVFLILNMLGALLARYVMRGIPVRSWQDFGNSYPWLEQILCAGSAVLLAALWRTAPVFEVLAVLPLTTLYRVLWFRQVEIASQSDAKTGLANVAYFTATAEREITRALRAGYPLSVILGDLDDLRRINNERGHLAGDAAIVLSAQILRDHVREVDLPCRFGGEEFAVLLPHAGLQEACQIAERLREELDRTPAEDPRTGDGFRVTMSLGVATLDPGNPALQLLIQRADDALYDAKRSGRNRVCAEPERPLLKLA